MQQPKPSMVGVTFVFSLKNPIIINPFTIFANTRPSAI